MRGLIWQLLCNVHNNRTQVREKYAQFLRLPSPCEKVIKRDIPRTFPEHDYFREKGSPGQEGLFNVMKAYSLFDSEVGYCQGSAFLVGLLLLNMPEEDAFTVFQSLMYDYRLREMFKPTMAELGLCIYQLECMVQVCYLLFVLPVTIFLTVTVLYRIYCLSCTIIFSSKITTRQCMLAHGF